MSVFSQRGALILATVWLALGALSLLAVTGAAPPILSELGFIGLVIPAIPLYLIGTGFETWPANEGALWAAAHGPPFLKPIGIGVLYFVPALLVIGWVFFTRFTDPGRP